MFIITTFSLLCVQNNHAQWYCIEASCTDCATIVAASVTGACVITFILGTSFGAIAHRSTMSKQMSKPCPKSLEGRNPPPESSYETMSAPTQREKVELQEKIAYEPIQQD